MSGRRKRLVRMSLIERALLEKHWHETAVRAQIHAMLGDDGHQFVNAAGRVLYVVLSAMDRQGVVEDMPEGAVIRGACNALAEQAGEDDIAPVHRAAIRSGLEACERALPSLPRSVVVDAARDMEILLKSAGQITWGQFPCVEVAA